MRVTKETSIVCQGKITLELVFEYLDGATYLGEDTLAVMPSGTIWNCVRDEQVDDIHIREVKVCEK